RGGEPTGVMAFRVASRIRLTPSPSKNICTSWPASASAFPWRKGKEALVGSSDPQALLIKIFNLLSLRAEVLPRKGNGSRFLKKSLRIIFLEFGDCGLGGTGGRRGPKLKHRAQPSIKISFAEGLLQREEGRFAGAVARCDP